jgi:glycerophosphoryl diester phosphodiesterase
MTPQSFTLIAHRGASDDAPENTFASFDLALEQGVNELEMDLHLTKGGVLVVIHDDTVERTTDGGGPVSEKTLEELQRLDVGSWFDSRFAGVRIPTLAEVLERYGQRAVLHLEMKANGPSGRARSRSFGEGMGIAGQGLLHQLPSTAGC